MKKTIKGFVLGTLITTILMSTAVGVTVKKTIEVAYNSVNLTVNNKKILADNILYDGTTYVPIRAVAEALGKDVGWDGETNTASVNDKDMEIDDHSNALHIQGEIKTLYTGAELSDTHKIISYDKKFENAYFLKMNGKYSNMGNNFISIELLNTLYPEYKDDIISEMQHFEVTKHNDNLYLGMVQVIRFFREKGLEFSVRDLNDYEGIIIIK